MIRPAVVGFDGFIDSIMDVVDRRRDMSPDGYERIRTIGQLASRIGSAAGKSMNLEIVEREERWGGNGPLLAGVVGRLGAPVTYIGAVGDPSDPRRLHASYQRFAGLCKRVIPMAAPGRTRALEFEDGKVMLNEPRNVQDVTWDRILAAVGGEDGLVELLEPAGLIGIVNWSLLGGVDGIFRGLIERVIPRLTPGTSGTPRFIYIDLTDPAKRTDRDLAGVLELLHRINRDVPVTLGVNLSEAQRIASVSGSPSGFSEQSSLEELERAAAAVRGAIDLNCVVIHRRADAAAAAQQSGQTQTAGFEGPFVAQPRISTGAGDHFNGGFAVGQSLQMPLTECLAMGCAVAGWYVRSGEGPDRPTLLEFLRNLPRPEKLGE